MEKVLSARTDMREKCLLWGLPGIVICIISLLVSLKVGYSFGQSSFVECITFAVCTALLFLLYWLIFQTLPQDLCNIIVSCWQKQTEQTNGISDIAEESRKQEKLLLPAVANIHSCPVQEDCGQTVEKPIEDSISVIQDATPLSESPLSIYDRCRSVHRLFVMNKFYWESTPIFLKPCPRSVIWKQSPLFRKMSWNGPMTRTMSREQYP